MGFNWQKHATALKKIGLMMKIGILVPFTNTNREPDLNRMPLNGPTTHVTRIAGYGQNVVPDAAQMLQMGDEDISAALNLISGINPDAILYGCTSATLAHGLEFDERLRDQIQTATKAYTITAAGALITALSALNVKNIGFASPYVPQLAQQSMSFLETAGIKTVSIAGPNSALSSLDQGKLSAHAVFDLAMPANHKNSQAIVLACTDLRAVEIIEQLEGETNKPVITSNQALIFALVSQFPSIKTSNLPGMVFNLL